MPDKVLIDAEDLKKYKDSLHSPEMKCGQCEVARQILAVAQGHAVKWPDGKVSFT